MYKNLVCVTDRKISRAPFLQQIETICALRPKALILREKDLTEAEYTQLAQKVQAICKTYGVKFIVHTFWRAGLALGADGAHLPLPVCAAMTAAERLQAGRFGVSVHSAEEAKAALALGAAYLTAGHIYASSCKFMPLAALGLIRRSLKKCWRAALPVPVCAARLCGFKT